MAQQQKVPQFPAMPYRYPFMHPPMMPEKLKSPQPNLQGNGSVNSTVNPNISRAPFMPPPRMFNPYFGGYNMFPMPPFPPYMPMMRPPQMPLQATQISKNQKQGQEKNPIPPGFFNRPPPFYNHPMFINPNQFMPTDQQLAKNQANVKGIGQKQQKNIERQDVKQLKPQLSSSSHTITNKDQSKIKVKQVKHADIKQYQPEPPKKKKKRQTTAIDNSSLRQTREKKQSIERIMAMVMKQRPPRDRIIKIGKQHQAAIPQSFINEYQYNLKIKLQKKKSLMSRLINQTQVL